MGVGRVGVMVSKERDGRTSYGEAQHRKERRRAEREHQREIQAEIDRLLGRA
ncbi:hypothetical protein ABZW02_20350 [Streptomyces sp. NPDC005180]|uniref:hypothetical protein n=1 Tax=Streptomyces sp. NPDC005180 TaxID=3156868 RepID=UPI0033BF00E9